MRSPLYSLIRLISEPTDTPEVRLQKSVLVTSGMLMSTCGVIWAFVMIFGGEPKASLIPLAYVLISILNVVTFRITRNYKWFLNIELTNSLILPLAVFVGLGGFVQSGAVVTWSLIAPLRAVLSTNRKATMRWLLAFLGVILLSALIDSTIYRENNLFPILKTTFFVLNISAPSSIAVLVTLYFVEQKNSAQELLKIEQEKSERLLLNVLPKEIAGILKDENRTIADRFDAVSVLFADIVGFTPLSAELDPVEMVNLLNEVFSYFDTLVAKYGLEKIRTIGDNYMVASGIPTPRIDHAHALANLALDMREFMGHTGNPHANRLQFRIGINYGPAVAGVVGQQKFHYDVWGDTVNVAARMESQGEPGMIQITQAMADLLKDEFVCEPRGTIPVKGKGEMQTWFLTGRKDGKKL